MRCKECALYKDETTRGAGEMRDADKIIEQWGERIVPMNETEGFGVELFAMSESFELGGCVI